MTVGQTTVEHAYDGQSITFRTTLETEVRAAQYSIVDGEIRLTKLWTEDRPKYSIEN